MQPTIHFDPYGFDVPKVDLQHAAKLLVEQKVDVDFKDNRDAIEIGLDLGYLTLHQYSMHNDYLHGPGELVMLRTNGILIYQPDIFGAYTVFHVVQVGYTRDIHE